VRYDDERISLIINDRRRSFKIRCGVILALMIVFLTVSIINVSDYLTVLCSMLEFPLLFLLAVEIKKFDAKTLMSGEIRGKNIKEYEYGIHGTSTDRIYRRGNMPHTFANKKILHPRINGTVYLELEDGNVTSISGLYKSHMEIYEDGDILVKYAGTRFPIVEGRAVKKQPCPICGEINDSSRDACRVCGLAIIKK
jgi:hypothetical protein